MATQAKIEIVLANGQKAGQTLKELSQTTNRLNKEVNNLTPGSQEFIEKTKDFQKVKARLNDVRSQVRGVDKAQKQVTKGAGMLNKAFSTALKTLLPLFALTKIIEFGKALLDLDKKWTKLEGTLKRVSGLQGEALEEAAVNVEALSQTFDKSTDEIVKSANVMSKQMGLSFSESMDIIEKGLLAGADVNGEFLEQLNEYAPQFKAAGIAADDFAAILVNATQQGIFSDKGADTVKEGMLRLREMPKATKDALDAIGISGDDLQKSMADGSLTAFEAIQKVSTKLETLPPQSAKVGTAIADIFGGAGEDAGLDYIISLKDINGELDSMVDTTDEYTKKQMEQLELQQELAQVTSDLANEFSGTGSIMDNLMLQGKVLFFDVLLKGLQAAKSGLVDTVNYFIDLYNESVLFRGIFHSIKLAAKTAFGFMIANLKTTVDGFVAFKDILKGIFTFDFDAVKEASTTFFTAITDNYSEFGNNAAENFYDAYKSTIEQKDKIEPISLGGGIFNTGEAKAEESITKLKDQMQRRVDIVSDAANMAALKMIKAQGLVDDNMEKGYKNLVANVGTQIKARKGEVKSFVSGEDEKTGKFMETAGASLNAASWLTDNISKLSDDESKNAKSLAIFEGELAAIQGGLQAFAAGSKFSPIIGGIWAALAFAFGQAQLIKMQNVKKADRGMVLRGPSHARGGIPIEAEGDEIILTKGVSQDPIGRAMASDLNAAYGGIRFMESGGPVNPLSANQVAATSGITGGATQEASEELVNEFRTLRIEMSTWQRNLQVHNNVQDTREGITVINNLESDAGF